MHVKTGFVPLRLEEAEMPDADVYNSKNIGKHQDKWILKKTVYEPLVGKIPIKIT